METKNHDKPQGVCKAETYLLENVLIIWKEVKKTPLHFSHLSR